MEGRLSDQLLEKIAKLELCRPYVWQLRLSKAEFDNLNEYVEAIVSTSGVGALSLPKNAILTIVYMAEWYKRCYQSGNKNKLVEGLDLEKLWHNSGISLKNYLYRDDSGNPRWKYSIYVLGGLAINHELNRNDNMRFLKGLCRLYHGEDYTLENLDDPSRAIAFRESIKRQHSLYEYMREILNGEMPFHLDDLGNERSDVNRFVSAVKAANDEILRVKFRFEWVVTFSPDYNFMTRRLWCWLKPEEVGGGLHQYLRYDRVHLWGVPNPEKQLHLFVHIRFMNGEVVVAPQTMDSPIITYLNNGVNDFIAFGVERGVLVKHIPASRFDKIEIVVKDDDGLEYIVQRQDTMEFIQLWRSEPFGDTWTSTQNAQKQTALLFSNKCKLMDETLSIDVYRKPLRDQLYGISEAWNWVYIYDSISFIDDRGIERSLFNRIGYDQVTTRLYTDTIHYVNGGKIRHYYIDDPDVSEELDVEELPVVFSREDVIVRHFATRDDVLNAQPENDSDIQLVEFKRGNGLYAPWTKEDVPSYGHVTLRITAKNQKYILDAVYLPGQSEGEPIIRDFDTTCIRYMTPERQEAVLQDTIPMDGKVLGSTLTIRFGEGNSYYEVDVYRPTLIKEVLFDGKIIKYLDSEDRLELPYIFKHRVQVNDFSKKGYQAYECKNLGNIYTGAFLNIAGNPSVGMAALAKWGKDVKYSGKLLDLMAPDCLFVCFGRNNHSPIWDGQEALLWNYDQGQEPTVVSPKEMPDFGIIFQNLSKTQDLICNYPIQADDDPWGFDDVEVSVLKCFEVANQAGTYFFLMKPLMEMNKNDIIKLIYEPLLEARGGILTDKDKRGLVRLGEEFDFDWRANNIIIDNE